MQSLQTENIAWPDNSIYFLTDSTFLHFPYFRTDEQKQIVLNQIKSINSRLNIPISDYSIAINHYHLKFFLKKGKELSEVKKLLRGGISHEYKKQYSVKHKEIWQSRKILIVKSEKMNWLTTGYIIGNLLKHKEVGTFDELKKNKYSSYWYMADKYGEKEMRDLVSRVIDVDENAYGLINAEQLDNINFNYRGLKSANPG